MDMNGENNHVSLRGLAADSPVFSHTGRGQEFYRFPLQVQRLSGTADTLNILLRRELLEECRPQPGERLFLSGQLRSFNNRSGQGAKLVITVLARELRAGEGPDENRVELRGALCKEPKLRCTPMGRDICDLMLAVNRHYGRSDYLPCICWGQRARQAADLPVGTRLRLTGRIQSRGYIKLTEEGPVEKTAFEVSVTELEAPV